MPEVEAFCGADTVTLNWDIENYSLYPCTNGKCILSPRFEVKKLGNSHLQLELYPKGSNNSEYIACYVCVEMEEARCEYCVYSFTLSLRVGDIDLFKVHETWNSEIDEAWKCEEFIKIDLLRPIHLPKDILSIRCVIQPEHSHTERGNLQELRYLSQNLISLLDSEEHHDLILITDDHTRFKVHKCVMSARWPNLLKAVLGDATTNYSNCGFEIKVPNTDSGTLKTMIRYVYSGIIDGPNVNVDVFRTSVKLNFSTLRKNLSVFPKIYFGVTDLTVDHKIVIWHLDDVSSWATKPPSFIRILPVTELYVGEIIILFSISIDADGDKAIDIAFQFPSIKESFPVFMKCKMSLSVKNAETSIFKEAKHLFVTNDFCHFPLPFKISDIPDKKRSLLTMELIMSDGLKTCKIQKSQTEFFTNFTPIRDLHKLSTDISDLFEGSTSYQNDCFVQGTSMEKIGAHRAILWARWLHLRPVLDIDVDEFGEEWCIKINIEERLLEDIIFYMYSGNSGQISTILAEKILEVSKTVLMPEPLLIKCREILESNR